MEQSVIEQKEDSHVSTETLTKASLLDLVFKGESEPQDKRFLPTEEGGVFRYLYLPDIISSLNPQKEPLFPVVKDGDEVVGLAQLEKSPYKENRYWISFISVDPTYQGKRYASKLVEEIFNFAKRENVSLQASSYKEDGWLKLKDILKREAEKTGIEWEDEENKM